MILVLTTPAVWGQGRRCETSIILWQSDQGPAEYSPGYTYTSSSSLNWEFLTHLIWSVQNCHYFSSNIHFSDAEIKVTSPKYSKNINIIYFSIFQREFITIISSLLSVRLTAGLTPWYYGGDIINFILTVHFDTCHWDVSHAAKERREDWARISDG